MGGFEVINVAVALGVSPLVMPRDEVGELGIQLQFTRFCEIEEGQFVYQIGKSLPLGAIAQVGPPEGVAHRFRPYCALGGKRQLREVHKRGSNGEVFAEAIIGIEAHHRFALHVHESLIFEGNINACTAIQDRFVDDSYGTHGVVDSVIYILRKECPPGCNSHRTGCYVGNTGTKTNLPRRCRLVLSSQDKLIALGSLSRHHRGIVVDLLVYILIGNGVIPESLPQCLTKRLYRSKENQSAACLYGVALHKVENTIGIGFSSAIETIHTEVL